MKYIISIFFFIILSSCGQLENENKTESIVNHESSSSSVTSIDKSITDTTIVFSKLIKDTQTVTVYNEHESIINTYTTILEINVKGKASEYIYSNSDPSKTDVNVNDLFQIYNDSLATYDYDTCKLIAVDTIKIARDIYEVKTYKFLEAGTNEYILFNDNFGILVLDHEFGKTEFGTKINENLKNKTYQ